MLMLKMLRRSVPSIVVVSCVLNHAAVAVRPGSEELGATSSTSQLQLFSDDSNEDGRSKRRRVSEEEGFVTPPQTQEMALPETPHLVQTFGSSSSVISKRKLPKGPLIERIVGDEEHMAACLEIINSAQDRLEIFSKTLGWLHTPLFEALKRAVIVRSVDVVLTVNQVKNSRTRKCLESFGIRIKSGLKTHTKCLIAYQNQDQNVDQNIVLIGSYNVLGHSNNEGNNASFKISGKSWLVEKISQRISQDLGKYQRGAKLPAWHFQMGLSHVERDDSTFHLLTNSKHHEEFFKCMVKNARDKIIIYSPFLWAENARSKLKTISDNIKEGVWVIIYIQPDNEDMLNRMLEDEEEFCFLKEQTIVLTAQFHQKTLVVDPQTDNAHHCEGSYNWLSAAPHDNRDWCKQETSVVISGPIAHQYHTDGPSLRPED